MQEEKPVRRGVYILPNLFTTASLFTGFLAMLLAVQGNIEGSALAILFSALMDGLDGKVARLTNTASEFGIQYDSLADLVAFGVAPAFTSWMWVLEGYGKLGIGVAFPLCGLHSPAPGAFQRLRHHGEQEVLRRAPLPGRRVRRRHVHPLFLLSPVMVGSPHAVPRAGRHLCDGPAHGQPRALFLVQGIRLLEDTCLQLHDLLLCLCSCSSCLSPLSSGSCWARSTFCPAPSTPTSFCPAATGSS